MRRMLAVAVTFLVVPAMLRAAEQKAITLPSDNEMAMLKPGAGVEVARADCSMCHSTDYIVLQPRGNAEQWQAVVTKMIKVFGAPISPEGEKTIVEYLSSAYGPEK